MRPLRKRVPLRAMPPARSPVLRASAARCSPRSAAWSKAPTMPRSSACASPSAASRPPRPFALRARALTSSPVRVTRPARRQAIWVSQIAEANDELDRVRRDDSEAAGKLADAKVRLAQTSERLRSLKGRVPDLEHRLGGHRPPYPRNTPGFALARVAAPARRPHARALFGPAGARVGLGRAPA